MREANLFLYFLRPLNEAGFEYMVTGAVASIIYGQPRMTHDIDMVLELRTEQVGEFRGLFSEDEFYCPPEDVILTEIARETRGNFNIIHLDTGFKADIYPKGNDKLHLWAFGKRQKIELEGVDVWVAPAEYVILRKLEYFREGGSLKHLDDIKQMLAISPDVIDRKLLQEQIEENGLEKQWQQVQSNANNDWT